MSAGLRACLITFLLLLALPQAVAAPTGRCLAVADTAPHLADARIHLAKLNRGEVEITFVGHSSFRITTPGGITIVTDYAGNAGSGPVPDIVTMNHAHETHYTDFPDKRIRHVLRGWNPAGGAADHNLTVGDVYIRNVPTDIRHWSGAVEKDGNSIFVFEVSGLCIGHLGHLHHELTPQLRGWIGRLDVVMVPVDGTFTLRLAEMLNVMKELRAQIILPMHYFGGSSLQEFLRGTGEIYDVELEPSARLVLSEASLPKKPKVVILARP